MTSVSEEILPAEGSEFAKLLQEEDEVTYNFQELLDALTEHRDMILTIPRDQVMPLRSGLSVAKAKRNAKFKSSGLAISTDTISYVVYDDETTKDTDNTKVRVKLGPRIGVNIKKLELPDDSF